MSTGIFGRKVGMTHFFDETGANVPVTLVKVDPCQISQIKTVETDGYNAIQLAYSQTELTKVSKPLRGHLTKSGNTGFKYFGEFRVEDPNKFSLGESVNLESDVFTSGQKVKVIGRSIGKGFTGNQKRHNFSRGPMTHGSKNQRLPGSIGAGSTPGRVYPGKKMAGQLGYAKTTIKSSEILLVNKEENILVLKGSLPGKAKNILKIITHEYFVNRE
jgi:large subunit ribosomal protein L3